MFKGIVKLTCINKDSKVDSKTIFVKDMNITVICGYLDKEIVLNTNVEIEEEKENKQLENIYIKNIKYLNDNYCRIMKKLKFAFNHDKTVELSVNRVPNEFYNYYDYELESLIIEDFED